MIIPIPIALVLFGALYWPVTLAIALVVFAVGWLVSARWLRVLCFIVAVLLIADCLIALSLRPD